jgi:acylphosphatase
MANSIAQRFVVSGRVQGVYYRASTRAKAQELGIRGHARNLPDGSVEVLAVGGPDEVAQLEKWLWQGPPAAQVTSVVKQDASPDSAPSGFLTH